ncbi:MAG: glycoside hydrolase family 15 protein [Polyangiaceae bacterium]
MSHDEKQREPEERATALEAWIREETDRATASLLKNVSPEGAMRGAIVASTSRSHPNYYFHWVRDAGIAVRALLALHRSATSPQERERYLGLLMDNIDFSRHIQRTARELGQGLGEARFTVDGAPSREESVPQDDGPAIRALEMIRLASALLDAGKGALVYEKLYDGRLPTGSLIKADLEYVAQRAGQPSFDCWEELWGHSFFTSLLQRKALREGARLAQKLGDEGAATFYLERAKALEDLLARHWDPRRGYLVSTLDDEGNPVAHRSGLDTSVVVATLGGYGMEDDLQNEDLYPVEHEHVLATVVALEDVFAGLYPINSAARGLPGIAMGRYPEDTYDGYSTQSLGNPWSSVTTAFAMYYHTLARRLEARKSIVLTSVSLPFFERLRPTHAHLQADKAIAHKDAAFKEIVRALRHRGDSFLERLRIHTGPDGALAEQMDRITGFQTGAADLTMSYAALVLAAATRRRA